MAQLSSSDREFFGLVSRAAFSNPFGEERDALDRRIAALGEGSGDELPGRLSARLTERLGGQQIRTLAGRDRELVEHAVLFDVFHRFVEPLDQLIAHQLKAGDESVPVPFAAEVQSLLQAGGLSESRAQRALPIFYQMRRAFFFIATDLVGGSNSMVRLRESLWNTVFTRDIELYERFLWNRLEDFSTILTGETGTGKGSAAAAMGRSGFIPFDVRSGRFAESFTRLFVPINLSQFSESLVESELFGHRKGAFTGAVDRYDGALAQCKHQGSVFLDEIGEVGPSLQIKLLRVLQEREFTPVGSHASQRFEGRVIAATHRDLNELRASGKMRHDFFYRLCSDVIVVPPLRQRLAEDRSELHLLVDRIVERTVGEPSPELSAMIVEAQSRDLGPTYSWPGNVRELEQCVRRVLLTGRCAPSASIHTARGAEPSLRAATEAGTATARELLNMYCALLYERTGTYEQVAKTTGLDRRTVKRHILEYTGPPRDF